MTQVIRKSSQKTQAKRSYMKVCCRAFHAAQIVIQGSCPHSVPSMSPCQMLVLPQTTIKTVNYQHMMPTRYTLDVDLRTLFSNDVLAERKRQKETCQVCCSGKGID